MTARHNLLEWIESPQQALENERLLLASIVSGERDTALTFWSTQQSLVVPRRLSRRADFPSAQRLSEQRGWPIMVRDSGGDATPQGIGVVNVTYAYLCDTHPPIEDSYRQLCAPIVKLVEGVGERAYCQSVAGSFCDGDYNVVSQQRKLAGTAQRRSRRRGRGSPAVLFAHALILVDADIVGGIDAINRFYGDFGQATIIDVDAHINLSAIGPSHCALNPERVVQLLHSDYQTMLENVY